jgi:predicted TIM-barrel fold metal-dependent hydrolase
VITDAQIHLWDPNSPERPWPTDRVQAQREAGYFAEDALREMDAIGVDRAVLVTPSWVGETNETCLAAAKKYPDRFAVMGRIDPRTPESRQLLAKWREQENMLGVRLTFIQPFQDLLDNPAISWFWDAAEEYNIPLMALGIQRLLDKLRTILLAHPRLTFIIDHLGATGKGPAGFAHLETLLPMAEESPNLCVKWSSTPNFSAEPFPHRDIEASLKRMYDVFGPRRIFWGSDITRLEGSYRNCLEHVRQLPFLSDDDKEWILDKGIAERLRWPEPASVKA